MGTHDYSLDQMPGPGEPLPRAVLDAVLAWRPSPTLEALVIDVQAYFAEVWGQE
jgi:hypothetical protein